MAWDIWNHMNHTLHVTVGTTKTVTIYRINTRVTYHFQRGMKGLNSRCNFILKTNIHIILYRPVRQWFSWMVSTSSDQKCSQCRSSIKPYYKHQPTLSQTHIYEPPHPGSNYIWAIEYLKTFSGTDQTWSLYIEREYDPHLFQDTKNEFSIEIIWASTSTHYQTNI